MNFTLAPGWTLTHIINLEPDWQVNLKDDEHVVVATGVTIEEALSNADRKIANHDYVGIRISVFAFRDKTEANPAARNLLESLGLAKPKTIVRRI